MLLEQWQLGVITSCMASSLSMLGGQLRVLSHTLEGRGSVRKAQGLLLLGWAVWLIGQGLVQLAMVLAPATIIACVTFSSALLANAVLAPVVLKEQFNRWHALGVILLSVGVSAVTETSAHTDQRYTLPELVEFGTRLPFLGTAACALLLATVVAAFSVHKASLDAWSFAYIFSFCGAVDMLVTKWTLLLVRLRLMARSTEEAPADALLIVSGVVMLLLHLMVFGFQMVSTRYGEVLMNMPIFLGTGAMMQVALCGNFFNEFDAFDIRRAVVFVGGFLMMLLGLGVTTRATPPEQPLLPLKEPLMAVEPVVLTPALRLSQSCGLLAPGSLSKPRSEARSWPSSPCVIYEKVSDFPEPCR